MEVLEIDGSKFVKASAIARELGYTSDYVGQLCRGGKVKSQLVGRSWYVEQDSIRDHKQNRYRSTKTKTKEALKSSLTLGNSAAQRRHNFLDVSSVVLPSTSKHFYTRDVIRGDAKYSTDESELIPILTESDVATRNKAEIQNIEVRHADAKNVSIKETSDSYTFETPIMPKIQFTGKVSIVDVPDEDDVSVENLQKPVAEGAAERKKNKPSKKILPIKGAHVVLRTFDTEKSKQIDVQNNGKDVHAVALHTLKKTTAKKIPTARHHGGELQVSVIPEVASNETGRYNFVLITASLAAAVFTGFILLTLEQSYITSGTAVVSSYNINLSAVLESIKGLK